MAPRTRSRSTSASRRWSRSSSRCRPGPKLTPRPRDARPPDPRLAILADAQEGVRADAAGPAHVGTHDRRAGDPADALRLRNPDGGPQPADPRAGRVPLE